MTSPQPSKNSTATPPTNTPRTPNRQAKVRLVITDKSGRELPWKATFMEAFQADNLAIEEMVVHAEIVERMQDAKAS